MPRQKRDSWSELQPELLGLILQKLFIMDYLNCRQVCQSWRRVIDDAITQGRCTPAAQFPLLILVPPPKNKPVTTILDLTQKALYTIPNQTWEGPMTSIEGWLMFTKYDYKKSHKQTYASLSLFNPVSREKCHIPPLLLCTGGCYNYSHYIKVAFSFAPGSSDFFVVISTRTWRKDESVKHQIALCMVADKSWTLIERYEPPPSYCHDIATFGWKLYVINDSSPHSLIVYNLRDPNAITKEMLIILDPKPILREFYIEVRNGVEYYIDVERHMLAIDSTCGEVLLVLILRDFINDMDRRCDQEFISVKGFRVFKLDMSGPRWIEIESLGDRFLLLDPTGIRVMPTINLNGPAEFIGGNAIFFCVTSKLKSFVKRDVGVFSLKDKEIRHFPLKRTLQNSGGCFWFTPGA